MLEIMIHKLLDNALKHSYGQYVTITSRLDESRKILITVGDTGFGMYLEITNWLNDNGFFRRGKKEVQVLSNLGLGLIIVKKSRPA